MLIRVARRDCRSDPDANDAVSSAASRQYETRGRWEDGDLTYSSGFLMCGATDRKNYGRSTAIMLDQANV